jgi:hypothetical protein
MATLPTERQFKHKPQRDACETAELTTPYGDHLAISAVKS